jgi:hypothetical protein
MVFGNGKLFLIIVLMLRPSVEGFFVAPCYFGRISSAPILSRGGTENHLISHQDVYDRRKGDIFRMAKTDSFDEDEDEDGFDDEFFAETAEYDDDDEDEEDFDEDEYDEGQDQEEEEDSDSLEENPFDEFVELLDDETDINYTIQKKILEESIERRNIVNMFQDATNGESSPKVLKENLEQFLDQELKEAGIDESEVDKYMQNFQLDAKDVQESIEELDEFNSKASKTEKASSMLEGLTSSPVAIDDFPPEDDPIYESSNIKPQDLMRLQEALEGLVGTIKGYQDGSLIDNKQAIIRPQYELDRLDRQTLDEINLCLNASAVDQDGLEYDETIKNGDPIRWLLYDLDFNVTNLMLASCKHNPEAPLLLNHWMPQLCAYSRYADVREREFQFSWEDCENADMDELNRYFKGLGYAEIPTFSEKETNIVNIETEYDQEDITMSAFENWMNEVYSEEGEDLYFDDEDFQPENNVFDFQYGMEDTDDLITFKSELEEFENEHRNETKDFRDKYVQKTNYTYIVNEEGQRQFRGHLVIACCGSDQDLELAEKITNRMKADFGEQVYVETRVYAHARQEDNLYEIWMESYDIELLHSRRGAFYNSKQWKGPADVDDKQLDFIVEKVGYMISDEARFSHKLHEFVSDV